MQQLWTKSGRLSFTLAISCILTGLWALTFGAHPAWTINSRLEVWPGALFALPLGLVLFGIGTSLIKDEDLDHLHRYLGSRITPPVAFGAAFALLLLILIQWEKNTLARAGAMELYLCAALLLAVLGPTMPPEPPAPQSRSFLPSRLSGGTGTPEGEEVEFTWSHTAPGSQGHQPFTLRVRLAEGMDPALVSESLASQFRAFSLREQSAPYDEIARVLSFAARALGPVNAHDREPRLPVATLLQAKAGAALGVGLHARTNLAAELVRALGYEVALLRAAGADQFAFAIIGVYDLPQPGLRINGRSALLAEIREFDYYLGDARFGAPGVQWDVLTP